MAMTAAAPQPGIATAPVDFEAIKARQQSAWTSGDYAIVGTTLQIVGEDLCEALDVRAGQKVLDVAAGNGNVSLAAARRWCDVVSTDYVPALLERARERAEAERLGIDFQEADAEASRSRDGSFDVVVSTFGVMFTPDQDRAAAELARVSASTAARSASPTGRRRASSASCSRRSASTSRRLRARGPRPCGGPGAARGAVRAACRLDHGEASALRVPIPLARALAGDLQDVLRTGAQGLCGAPAAAQATLEQDLRSLIDRLNRARDGTMVVPSEYLEVVIVRR